jgi:NagD protein
VVGEGALIHELYKAGFTITDVNPDFVIVGETRSFNWEMMHKAAYFVANGARFIATNPDTHGRGFYPACGALCAGIEKISGRKPFVSVNRARGSSAPRSTKCRPTLKRP